MSIIQQNNTSQFTLPLISIIVVNYNNAPFLPKCLDSVISQTLNHIEIIVVDDYSSDCSRKIINEYVKRDSRIRPIYLTKNSSQHIARKTGVRYARGQYLMFLDSDDFYAPQACEIAYKAIADGYDIVCFKFAVINMNEQITTDWKPNSAASGVYKNEEIFDHIYVLRDIPVSVWSKIYKSEVWRAACEIMEDGFFPMAQDVYEGCSLLPFAKSLMKIEDVLYFYRWGERISYAGGANKTKDNFIKFWSLMPAMERLMSRYGEYMRFRALLENIYTENVNNFFKFRPLSHVYEYLVTAISSYPLRFLPQIMDKAFGRYVPSIAIVLNSSVEFGEERRSRLSSLNENKCLPIELCYIGNSLTPASLPYFQALIAKADRTGGKLTGIFAEQSPLNAQFMRGAYCSFQFVSSNEVGEPTDLLKKYCALLEEKCPDVCYISNICSPDLIYFLFINWRMRIPTFGLACEINEIVNIGIVSKKKRYSLSDRLNILKCFDMVVTSDLDVRQSLQDLQIPVKDFESACIHADSDTANDALMRGLPHKRYLMMNLLAGVSFRTNLSHE